MFYEVPNMFKKLISTVLSTATLFAASPALAQDVLNINILGKEEEELIPVKADFTKSGPTLLFSDSPEMVYEKGVLYRDVLSGSMRLFFHHVNSMARDKKLAVIVKNKSNLHPVNLKVIRRGVNDASYNYLRDGKEAEERYFGKQKKLASWKIGFCNSVELITGRGYILEENQLLTGIIDFEADKPVEVSVIMCEPQTDLELYNETAPILPMDEHPLRGTFPKADWNYAIKSPIKPIKDNVYFLRLAGSENYIKGTDKTTGLPAENYGNYGVVYTVDFQVDSKKPVQFLFNPIGGEFAGYATLEHDGEEKIVALPKKLSMGKTIEDMVELGRLKNGSYRFTWSPPGASNLPIRLLWRQKS